MDRNLYCNPGLSLEEVKFNGVGFERWRKLGKDAHSAYADPLFVDAADCNLALQCDCPLFAFGFEQVDAETIGPRR